MKKITLKTQTTTQLLDITREIEKAARELNIEEGVLYAYVPHTTAGITINEHADPDVARDIVNVLNKLIPIRGDYAHMEGNAHAHVKATLVGSSVSVLVKGQKLQLGTWQGIFFCEFDGPRSREVWVSAVK
jgi:secondary thiamine-phosphate synthase enzyme